MSKPFIYLDQNVLGLQLEGKLNLSKIDNVQWVYSTEHFSEIRRSLNPQQYLEVMDQIKAKLLRLELKDRKMTGTAQLVEAESAEDNYAEHLDSIGDVNFNENVFDAFQVWVNGGGNEELLRSFPGQLFAQIQALTEALPLGLRPDKNDALEPSINDMVEQMAVWGNDINRTREALGGGKGAIGSITGKNQLLQVWEIIRPACGSLTSDQFFGFDPPNKQGYDSLPVYLGIISCCAVLDIIGFQAEKKCRQIEKIPNVRSDSVHIAMGAYCSAILSKDRRLSKRAKAIYEYKGIGTVPLLVEVAR